MIDRNHPAVEAVAREIYVHDAPSNDPQTWPPTPTALADDYRGAAIAALTAAVALILVLMFNFVLSTLMFR